MILPPHPIPELMIPNAQELEVIAKRLQKLIMDYLQMAPKLQIQVQRSEVRKIILQSIEMIDFPDKKPLWNETPKDYFLQGLFEELNLEPGNILTEIKSPEGVSSYAPLSIPGWKESLLTLQKKF